MSMPTKGYKMTAEQIAARQAARARNAELGITKNGKKIGRPKKASKKKTVRDEKPREHSIPLSAIPGKKVTAKKVKKAPGAVARSDIGTLAEALLLLIRALPKG
jgi:hypothetical protein